MYQLENGKISVFYSPETAELSVNCGGEIWRWLKSPLITLKNGAVLSLSGAKCVSKRYVTGTCNAVRATYSGFPDCDIALHTLVGLDVSGGMLRFEAWLDNEEDFEVDSLSFPAPFDFGAEEGRGYTVLSRMQGILIPAKYDFTFKQEKQPVLDRPSYMPIFGQVKNGTGYLAIFDTPYDCAYDIDHTSGGDTTVTPLFIPSLEKIGYRRIMLYSFDKDMDYVRMAKLYRKYLKEHGQLVTLKQKIEKNPGVKKIIGVPIVHTGIAVHIHEKSHYYTPGKPEKNDYFNTFDSVAKRLEALKAKGVKKAYLHLDGWGNHGYDNLHPDPFPPHEAAGGAKGMKELQKTCKKLGYTFGIHDQYRDYYYDAPTFTFDTALQNADGSHPYCDYWYGGPHSYLCQMLAPEYVKRNYDEFEKLGIKIEGAYLDVYSVAAPDQCFSPEHRMTRRDSVDKRNECFEILNERGIVPSSEEAVGPYLNSIALCHHAPFFIEPLGDAQKGRAIGVCIPLLNLVYHDCIVIPWDGALSRRHGGWGCPYDEWSYLYALLNGGTVYVSPEADEESLTRVNTATELHGRVGMLEMTKHEFLDGYKKQKTTFADGTEVIVDFESDGYEVKYPERRR